MQVVHSLKYDQSGDLFSKSCVGFRHIITPKTRDSVTYLVNPMQDLLNTGLHLVNRMGDMVNIMSYLVNIPQIY